MLCRSIRTLVNSVVALAFLSALTGQQAAMAQSAGDWDSMHDQTPKQYVCGRIDQGPVIDGDLSDAAWQNAPWTDAFVDIQGSDHPTPRHATRARMVWDDTALYIAAQLDEPHVWAKLKEHDAVIFHDNDFEVFLDPNGDNHHYLELELNALNTTWDLFLNRPYKDAGTADNGWEFAGLKTAVKVQGTLNQPGDEDTGWTVEIAIPWTGLQTPDNKAEPPQPGALWRINFSRVQWQHTIVDGQYKKVPGKPEDNWVWSPPGIIDMHRPERWGYLQFSALPPGEEKAQRDPHEPAREVLMEIYHRQKSYQSKHGRYADSWAELEWNPQTHDAGKLAWMWVTDQGYEATVESSAVGPDQPRWRVFQDSRITNVANKAGLSDAMQRAGANTDRWSELLAELPFEQREAGEFLLINMPDRDLRSLSNEYLKENLRLAHEAHHRSVWKRRIPREIFLNYVLPYANINERRDDWRASFTERFAPMVKGATSPSQAAAWLNQKLFPEVKVKYSTQRRRADQSPLESIDTGLASCTGLSVLLIDACRSQGIPARFVGTPLWADKSGNHSWVEIWDGDWHFTGAAEPSGDQLDQAWFIDRASTAIEDKPEHAIYAVTFQRTPLHFPLVWDPQNHEIPALNVTRRYQKLSAPLPEGMTRGMFSVRSAESGQRLAVTMKVLDDTGAVILEEQTKDERFDTNDFLSVPLKVGAKYRVEFQDGGSPAFEMIEAKPAQAPWVWVR